MFRYAGVLFLSFLTVSSTLVRAAETNAATKLWEAGAVVRVATEGAYQPWNFRDKKGGLVGFEIDLVRILCEDLQFTCPIQPQAWSGMLQNLNEDSYDVIFAGMSITTQRKQRALFTRPYAATPAVFVVRSDIEIPTNIVPHIGLPRLDAAEVDTVDVLRRAFLNQPIGVQGGTTHENFLRRYLEGYALLRTYDRQTELDADVKAGRLSAMLVSLGYAAPMVESPDGRGLKISGPRFSGGPFGEGIAAAVRHEDAALADAFSSAIQRRLEDGTVEKLALKWFGFNVSSTAN